MIENGKRCLWLNQKELSHMATGPEEIELLDSADRLQMMMEPVWLAREGANTDCPCVGQCAPTALLVQDIYGGEIVRAHIGFAWLGADGANISLQAVHWFNLRYGIEIDLTRHQYEGCTVTVHSYSLTQQGMSNRDHLLASDSVRPLYEKLKANFTKLYPCFHPAML